MSTATDERTDLEIIEHLDWEHVPACEHRDHGRPSPWPHSGPAHVLVRSHCPRCPSGKVLYLCKPWWDFVNGPLAGEGECDCGFQGTAGDFYTLLAWVNG